MSTMTIRVGVDWAAPSADFTVATVVVRCEPTHVGAAQGAIVLRSSGRGGASSSWEHLRREALRQKVLNSPVTETDRALLREFLRASRPVLPEPEARPNETITQAWERWRGVLQNFARGWVQWQEARNRAAWRRRTLAAIDGQRVYQHFERAPIYIWLSATWGERLPLP